jgi:NAD(P)-dependent dehydrogenase (short-subunit alcohol dehydrogenase family)
MPTVLITGSNRGLGLEFTRQYAAEDGWTVIATCRTPDKAEALRQLAEEHFTIRIEQLDVTDQANIATLADKLKNEVLDLLINNAGIASGLVSSRTPGFGYDEEDQKLGKINVKGWENILRINTIAPVMMTQTFLPNLRLSQAGKIVMLSSRMGSIEHTKSTEDMAYRTSKAALNMAMRTLALSLLNEKIIVISVNPGWVQTDMGGQSADITPEKSVGKMRKLIEGLTMKQSGQFFRYDGTTIPW